MAGIFEDYHRVQSTPLTSWLVPWTVPSHLLNQCWHIVNLALENTINSLRRSDAYMRRQTNLHWFRKWLVAWTAPSHYLNQCWNIVNWNPGSKFQWNFNRYSNIFIQINAFENVVCEMASNLSWPQCVDWNRYLKCIWKCRLHNVEFLFWSMNDTLTHWGLVRHRPGS